MSITPDERQDMEQALNILRTSLRRERESRREWQAWALVLQVQLRREGWVDADFHDLRSGLGLSEWGQD